MNKRIIIVIILLLGSSTSLWAQTSCERSLDEAKADYANGNLYAVPGKLTDCLEDGYTKTEKVEALRLLTLTYININQQEKAKETLIRLLKLKTDYQAVRNVDPSELYSLYKKIDTDIKYFIGITLGTNLNSVRPVLYRSAFPIETTHPQYSARIATPQVGFQYLYPLNKSFIVGAEIQFQNQRYSYSESFDYEDRNSNFVTYDSNNNGINLNLIFRYMKDFYTCKPFVELGSTARTNLTYDIINYTNNFERVVDEENIIESEENINERVSVYTRRSTFNFALNANLGSMIKVRENYVEIKFGVSNYFRNHLNSKGREEAYTTTLLDGGFIKEDDRLNLLYQINFTFNIPFFNFQ